jgi:ribose transport system permease protein
MRLAAQNDVETTRALDGGARGQKQRVVKLGKILVRAVFAHWIVLILLALVFFFSVLCPGFLSDRSARNLAAFTTEPLILAIGQTFVIVSGGIDLSVGAVLALSGVAAALAMKIPFLVALHNPVLTISAGMLGGLLTGTCCGLVNGLIIARLRIPPFVVTLGMLGIARGLTFILSSGASIVGLPSQLGAVGNQVVAGFVPMPFVVAIAIACVASFVLFHTRFGRHTFAIGGNRRVALRAGIGVARHTIITYCLSGFLAAVAGIFLLARFSTASPIAGQQSELNAITAAVIGGASLFGGSGTILGSVIGAFIIGVLLIGLVMSNVPPYWQLIATGSILIIAVFIDQARHSIQK